MEIHDHRPRLVKSLPSRGEQRIPEASHGDLKENGVAVRFFTQTTGRKISMKD